MTVAADLAALTGAWRAWEDQCLLRTDRDRRDLPTVDIAGHVEDACRRVAAAHGVPTTGFRDRIVERRRAGLNLSAAIAAACPQEATT